MSVMVVFLLLHAVLLALAGGLGTAGTLSLNVIEWTREIGVIRAIGATDRMMMAMILGRVVSIGLMSWIGTVPVSYVLSKIMSDQVGIQLFQSPLSFSFASDGVVVWH